MKKIERILTHSQDTFNNLVDQLNQCAMVNQLAKNIASCEEKLKELKLAIIEIADEFKRELSGQEVETAVQEVPQGHEEAPTPTHDSNKEKEDILAPYMSPGGKLRLGIILKTHFTWIANDFVGDWGDMRSCMSQENEELTRALVLKYVPVIKKRGIQVGGEGYYYDPASTVMAKALAVAAGIGSIKVPGKRKVIYFSWNREAEAKRLVEAIVRGEVTCNG